MQEIIEMMDKIILGYRTQVQVVYILCNLYESKMFFMMHY